MRKDFAQLIYTDSKTVGWDVTASSYMGNENINVLVKEMGRTMAAETGCSRVQVTDCGIRRDGFLTATVQSWETADGRPNKLVHVIAMQELNREPKWVFAPDFTQVQIAPGAQEDAPGILQFEEYGCTAAQLAEKLGLRERLAELMYRIFRVVYGLDYELVFVDEQLLEETDGPDDTAAKSLIISRDVFALVYQMMPEWMRGRFSATSYVNRQRINTLFGFSDQKKFGNCFDLSSGQAAGEITDYIEQKVFASLADWAVSSDPRLHRISEEMTPELLLERGRKSYNRMIWMYAMQCLGTEELMEYNPDKMTEEIWKNPAGYPQEMQKILLDYYTNDKENYQQLIKHLKQNFTDFYYSVLLKGNADTYAYVIQLYEHESQSKDFRALCDQYDLKEALQWKLDRISEEMEGASKEKLEQLTARYRNWPEWKRKLEEIDSVRRLEVMEEKIASAAGYSRLYELCTELKRDGLFQDLRKNVEEQMKVLSGRGVVPMDAGNVRQFWYLIREIQNSGEIREGELPRFCRSIYQNTPSEMQIYRIWHYINYHAEFGTYMADEYLLEQESYEKFGELYHKAKWEGLDFTDANLKVQICDRAVGFKLNAFYLYCLIMKEKDIGTGLQQLNALDHERMLMFCEFLLRDLPERGYGNCKRMAQDYAKRLLETEQAKKQREELLADVAGIAVEMKELTAESVQKERGQAERAERKREPEQEARLTEKQRENSTENRKENRKEIRQERQKEVQNELPKENPEENQKENQNIPVPEHMHWTEIMVTGLSLGMIFILLSFLEFLIPVCSLVAALLLIGCAVPFMIGKPFKDKTVRVDDLAKILLLAGLFFLIAVFIRGLF